MKRLLFISLAALFVLLSYPSTHSVHAGVCSAEQTDSGVIDKRDLNGPRIGLSGEGDDGDADGLSGIVGGSSGAKVRPYAPSSNATLGTFQVMIQTWWKFMILIR